MAFDPSLPEGAIRYFTPDRARTARTLREKLMARQTELAGFILAGAPVDFPDFRHRLGQIEGLREAIDICEQMEKDEVR